jgi:hypothetical protein
MMFMRIAIALVIGALVWVLCLGLGTVLAATGVPVVVTIGKFIAAYAVIIGILGAALSFLTGWSPIGPRA